MVRREIFFILFLFYLINQLREVEEKKKKWSNLKIKVPYLIKGRKCLFFTVLGNQIQPLPFFKPKP